MAAESDTNLETVIPDRGLSARKSSWLTGVFALIGAIVWSISLYIESSLANGGIFYIGSLILASGLLTLIWFDVHAFRLPNLINYSLIFAGLFLTWYMWPEALFGHVIAALIGYGLIWLLGVLSKRFKGRAGIGLGDAKLLAASGAWFGLISLPFILLISSGLGLLMALILFVRRSDKSEASQTQAIPFGPALSLAIWLFWCFGGLIQYA